MIEDIFENINNTLITIDSLSIPKKFKGDKLTADEFNELLGKINEIKEHLNTPVKDTFVNTTSYLMNKINNISFTLNATQIPIEEGSSYSIFNELENINNKINFKEQETNNSIQDIQSSLNDIELSLGLVNDKIETSYNASKEYTDEKVEESYNKLYTHITDTTLTFDYDIKTEPEEQKIIYDNNNDLYDGEYHD